jgi:hypothetical protein
MIQLKTGDFIEASNITAIRIGKRIVKNEKTYQTLSHPPRVLVDFSRNNVICIPFKTLRDAKAYAEELHEKVQEEAK